MKRIKERPELLPLYLSLAVMCGSLLIYIAGPIRWIDKINFAEIATILLLVCYFVSFAAGYLFRFKRYGKKRLNQSNQANSPFWVSLLRYAVWINLFLTVTNAQIYSGTSDVFSLLGKAIQGLFSPESVYFDKDTSSRMGNVAVLITFIYSPIMYATNLLAIFKFKQLGKYDRLAVGLTLIFEVVRWVSVGTNKGLFDIVLLFVTLFLIFWMHYLGRHDRRTEQNKRNLKRIALIVLIAVLLFFLFFSVAISARVNGEYNNENYASFPYNLVPKGLRFFVDKVCSYLVQGYDNMEKIIENCQFRWTFGFGNSRFSMQILNTLLGVDLTGRTYPYQLQEYGVDALAYWHSAYSWLASDLTFVGVIVLMFFVGYYMCGVAYDVIYRCDPIAMALLYLMIMMVVNASCTNYVLAYANGFSGFWGLFAIRWFMKHPRVVNKLLSVCYTVYRACAPVAVRIYRKAKYILRYAQALVIYLYDCLRTLILRLLQRIKKK